MNASRGAAILGVGQTDYGMVSKERTLPELAQEAALSALDHAGILSSDIEAVIFAMAPTALSGIDSIERLAADFVCARDKPFMRVNTGGATGASACHLGYLHVASGLFRNVLVVGAEKMTDTPDAQHVLNAIWDPIYEKSIALNAINMCSFQAVRHMHKYGSDEDEFASVAVRSRRNGTVNPRAHLRKAVTADEVLESRILCWPIKALEACPRSSGACAVVIGDAPRRDGGERPAWITGVGARTSTYHMGDKMGAGLLDHADWDELRDASKSAYRQAGIGNPSTELDVAEIYAPFSSTEVAAVEALGLVGKGEGGGASVAGRFNIDGEIPVNPSGGVLCANPISVTALVRIAEAALQVMNAAGDHQVGDVEHAVATGVGGSLQFHTCTVLSAEPRRSGIR